MGCSGKENGPEQPEIPASLIGEWKITSVTTDIEGVDEATEAELGTGILNELKPVYAKDKVIRFNESGSMRDNSGLGAYSRVGNTLLLLHEHAKRIPAFYSTITSLDETSLSISLDLLSEKVYVNDRAGILESYPGLTKYVINVEAELVEGFYTEDDSEEFDDDDTFTSYKETSWFSYDTQLVIEGLSAEETETMNETMGSDLAVFHTIMMNAILMFRDGNTNTEFDGTFYSSSGNHSKWPLKNISDTACEADVDFMMGIGFTDKGAGKCTITFDILNDDTMKTYLAETFPNLTKLEFVVSAVRFRSEKFCDDIIESYDQSGN